MLQVDSFLPSFLPPSFLPSFLPKDYTILLYWGLHRGPFSGQCRSSGQNDLLKLMPRCVGKSSERRSWQAMAFCVYEHFADIKDAT